MITSCESVSNSTSNGDIVPEVAGPKRNNSTGPESQQTSTESAEVLFTGRLARSKIVHNIRGLNVRITDSL